MKCSPLTLTPIQKFYLNGEWHFPILFVYLEKSCPFFQAKVFIIVKTFKLHVLVFAFHCVQECYHGKNETCRIGN